MTPKTVADLTRPMLDMMLSAGVTSMTEANSNPVTIAAYSLLADQHLLKMRVRTCALWEVPMPFAAVTGAPTVVRDRLDTRCVKIFVDGETSSGRTAALIDPYQPADGSTTNERGSLRLSREALREAVTYFDKAGITVKFHAMGDAAVEAAISGIEARAQRTARTARGTKWVTAFWCAIPISPARAARMLSSNSRLLLGTLGEGLRSAENLVRSANPDCGQFARHSTNG